MNNLLFYDIEVFQYDSLVVFKDATNKVVYECWNNDNYDNFGQPNGFEKVAEVIKDMTLVGYNNHHYDDIILTCMIEGYPQRYIKVQNDAIINGTSLKKSKIENSLDCMQELANRPSLKLIEGNMGKSIKESDVPFDIKRPLNVAELYEVEKYCEYDVENTIEVYKLREKSYFETKEQLLTMLDNPRARKWNTTTISANVLLDSKLPSWNRLQIPRDKWRNVEGIPADVWNMWNDMNSPVYDVHSKGNSKTIEAFGCEVKFGSGGLHGAPVKPCKCSNVKLLDVGSMYPSIIILLQALGDSTGIYDNIRKERLEIKHKDKTKSNALKLILNSVYGNLKNEYSLLYNPLASSSVCVYGQIALFDLCRDLYNAGYKIININTDGVAFNDERHVGNEYKTIWKDWETRWGLYLELDEFDEWWQKDVNNYIATQRDKIKCKGGEVNKVFENKYFANNDCRIVQIALMNKIVFNKDPIDTLMEHLDEPLLYQYVLKAGRTYKGVYDKDGNKLNNVNRVFALNKKHKGTMIYKVRQDDGYVNFPDVPENMLIWNDDVSKIGNFSEIVDLNHYYKIVQKKLKGWRE